MLVALVTNIRYDYQITHLDNREVQYSNVLPRQGPLPSANEYYVLFTSQASQHQAPVPGSWHSASHPGEP